MLRKDIEYYRQRVSAERRLALRASRQDVAAIHEELANQYQVILDQADLKPKLGLKFGAGSPIDKSAA